MFAKLRLPIRLEAGRVGPGGTDAEGERLPPLLEAGMFDADRESAFLDLAEPRLAEQPAEVTLARTRKLRLTFDVGIELARRLPEQAQWPLAAGMIPNARRDDAVLRVTRAISRSPATGSAMK